MFKPNRDSPRLLLLSQNIGTMLLGGSTKNVARVQDAMAIKAIQDTAAPLARRGTLLQIKALVHHRASEFEKQTGANGYT